MNLIRPKSTAGVIPGIIRVSTDNLPERSRVEAYRESYGRTIITQDVELPPDCPFHFDATLYALPGLGLASGRCSPVQGRHTSRHVDSDDLVLNVTLHGGRTIRQRGREATAGEGEAVLLTSADAAESMVHTNSRIVSFRVPLAALRPMIADLDTCLLRTIPHDAEALRLLTSYVAVVGETDALSTPELCRVVVAHLHDLISVTVGATRDAAAIARGRGVRAARLRGIKGDIADNLGRRDLAIDFVAARHRISPRYVRRLFESEGTSFSEFVLGQRLARAHRMLCDPRCLALTISAIAFECGFGDLSYFNRTFRALHGATPSDMRETARRENER